MFSFRSNRDWFDSNSSSVNYCYLKLRISSMVLDLVKGGVQADFLKALVATGTPIIAVLINGGPVSDEVLRSADAVVETWCVPLSLCVLGARA